LQDVAQIQTTARHLNSLIADLLDLSNKQIGHFKFQREMLDLLETLDTTLMTGQRLAQEKGLTWKVRAANNLPEVFADKTRLRQLVMNLITNAVKFTREGSIVITLEADAHDITFTITDTGCGIPLEEQVTIFDEFRQAEYTRERHYAGLGIGLATSKYIVELHQGNIGVQSQENHGATFYFSLPIHPPDFYAFEDAPAPPTSARALTQGTAQASTKTILIVDDEPSVLELHARMIENYAPHYEILRARNGMQALKIVRYQQIDLILLDWQMPQMDGSGVLKLMQQDKRLSRIPVIVLTTQPLRDEEMELLNYEAMVTLLQKGVFSLEETLHYIGLALGKNHRLRGESMRLVRMAMNYVHRHYNEPLTREQITGYVAVSQDHLNRCFQQQLGISIMAYLTRYRISQAQKMLLGGRSTVGEIAEATGFASTAYFCRVFRRDVGVSPRAYRQRHALPDMNIL